MSGGQLVVLDPSGAAVKMYELGRGLATLGSRAPADIRIMLPEVCPHHATITVHNSQTVIRNVGEGETLVNGESVTVAALKHKDLITIGGRDLRWEYSAPNKRQQVSLGLRKLPAGRGGARAAGGVRRASTAAAPPPPRDRALQLAIEMSHRASMPASSGGKQVAIVQPQRRDNVEHNVPQNTTQATLWIESRKSSPRRRTVSPAGGGSGRSTLPGAPPAPARRPRGSLPAARRALSARRSTPLRLTVLKRAQSATKMKVVKIEAPSKIDHTKQAAIMLMTGHTPRARLSLAQPRVATPSYVVKKQSPVGKTPGRKGRLSGRGSASCGGDGSDGVTPKRRSVYQESRRSSKRGSGNNSVSILEITDSDSQSAASSSRVSPGLPTPKKSALKDFSKKSARKTESIKFDLSNLENHHNDTTRYESEDSTHDEELTLHYSESSTPPSGRVPSPSPRRSIHSRSSRMLEQVGAGLAPSPSRTLSPRSPSSRRSDRTSLLLQRALHGTDSDCTSTDRSGNTTVASAFRTRTLTPRKNMESFSIVDLVSINSDTSQDCSKSVYNSLDSVGTQDFGTPNESNRKSRSTINPSLLGCSTPYASTRLTRSTSIPGLSQRSTRSSGSTQRSMSLSTPENQPASAVSAAPARRGTRSRSRINDTDLLLLDETGMDDSPRSSRRSRAKDASKATDIAVSEKGSSTPENRLSPVDAGTPVLSIQSFLDSSRSSNQSSARKGNKSRTTRRKTVGVPSARKRRSAAKSKSLGATARRSILHHSFESENQPEGAENNVTPRGSVRLEQEAVKNQHSTAKKPQSRRSIIDDLERSDIVKQLFNSPVKRKLSRSMTEFERRYDDDDDAVTKRPARHTLAAPGRSGEDSLSDLSGTFTPERFVSPIGTPSHSPNLSGIKRLFQRTTPENDLRSLRGERSLLRTHRTRKSIKNDVSNVTGLKLVFASSPQNRLSDVRVKEVFRRSPNNDLRRVSGVKSLFGKETSPKNDLSDIGGVKELFRRSPTDDLRNVSGVKRILRKSPRNDLTDVRGVGRMFRHGSKTRGSHDVSGLVELFNESSPSHSSEELFDRLLGKPVVRKVYSRTFCTRASPEPERRKGTFHVSLERIPDSVEVLARDLKVHRRNHKSLNITKEMQKLVTSTVDGEFPFLASRTRNSSLKKSASELYSAHTLPIKKRSLASPRAAPASPRAAPASPCAAPAPRLPLKKRAVLHSTPMKGRHNVTMNASELGRVSPIRALDNTHAHNASNANARTTSKKTLEAGIAENEPSKAKTPQKSVKLSPKASTSRVGSPPTSPKAKAARRPKASPEKVYTPPKRVTRNRNKSTTASTSKKGRVSLVIGKKAPVMSPRAGARVSPPPRRAYTRKQVQEPPAPAKRSRVTQARAALVIPKPSPKLKPQAASQTEDKPKRTRRNVAVHFESPKESQSKMRDKKNDTKGKENKTDNFVAVKPKRGRNPAAGEAEPPATRRGRGAWPSAQGGPASGSSLTNAEEPGAKQPKGRAKKVETVDRPIARSARNNTENVSVEPQPKSRGKKTEPPLENVPKMRGKKIEIQLTQPEPVTRGRRVKEDNTVIPGPSMENRRKRKTVPEEEVPAKVAKTVTRRGRKVLEPAPATTADKKPAAKARATKDKDDTQQGSKTRGKKVPDPASATTAYKQPAAKARATKDKADTQQGSKTRGRTVPEPAPATTVDKQPATKARATTDKDDTQQGSKTRGRKVPEPAPATTVDKQPATRARATKDNDDTQQGSKTRGKKVQVNEPAPAKPTRGRKVVEPEESPVAEKRKRKIKEEASPVKGKKPSLSVAKRARLAVPSAGRASAPAPEGAASGRSRRRR